ncbi:hypothetical protein ACL02O_23730 [Micromonospora sp. MS34]|uniref:hypothetical protein n=1 Tax=Micromonospora sp. MS34 TaxID=3385971 RepID=UPI0039A126AE
MTAHASRARFEFKVELYLGSVTGWVDITADVRGPVSIHRGQPADSTGATPGSCSLRLDNRSGDYSPRNGAGQWYGLLGRNTPLRVSAGLAGGTLYDRFYGEVSEWPARWSLDEVDRYVDVTASGILRRLGQGEQPSWSAMRRTIQASDPVGYWPLEDGTDAGQGGSALAGIPAATIVGASEFAAIEDTPFGVAATDIRYGTAALLNLAGGGTVTATLPASATAATVSAWAVSVAAAVDYTKLSGDVVISEVATPGGTHVLWQLIHRTSTLRMQVVATNAAGSTTTVIDSAGVYSTLDTYDFGVWQNGANIDVGLGWYLGSYGITGSVAGTLAGATSVTLNATGATQTSNMPFGHLAVWAAQHTPVEEGLTDSYGVFVFGSTSSWRNEAATDRLARVCAEEGVPLDMPAVSDAAVQRMGWQPVASFADLPDQCVAVDGGYLFEQRTALGLAYRTRESLYNQTPTPIAYSGQLAEPFEPVDDDAQVRNDITVKRTDGSSARAVQDSGPLAAVAPPDGVGVYRTEVELNLYDDAPLPDQAGWRVHLGTVDRPRYPALSVQLAAPGWQADPSGMAALLAVDTGDVIEVVGLPSWAAGDARTLVTGYSESFDEWTWVITFAGVPAQPWDVGEADGDARVAADGSTLAAALAAPTALAAWDFTASSGTLGWSGLNGSVAISGGALLCTPNGSSASVEFRSPNTPVVAATVYQATATATCAASRTVTPILIWRNSGGSLLSSTSGTAVSVTAGVPAQLTVRGTAPASATQAQLSLAEGSTPPASHTLSVDVAQLYEGQTFSLASTAENGVWTTLAEDFPLDVRVGEERVTVSAISGTSSPQTATVSARAVNGVSAAWPAGTEVDVWLPAVVAL